MAHRHHHQSAQTASMALRRKSRGLAPEGVVIQGGHDESRFVSAVPEHFKCPICLDVLRDPVQCPEEHAFCRSCIHFHLATQSSCPQCKTELQPHNLNPWSRVLRNLLGELKLTCEHRDEGCQEVLTLSGLAAHEKLCQYGNQPCRYCRDSVPAKQLPAHEFHCTQRSIVCKQCGLRVYPNKPPKHDCIKALKTRIKGLASHIEQLRVDFQQRLRPFERYVRLHESGSFVTWENVLEQVQSETTAADQSSSSIMPRTPAPRHEASRLTFEDVEVAQFRFDATNKGEQVDLRNDCMTMTSKQEDSGGCAVGTMSFTRGVWYWEIKIEAMWDSEGSDGSIRVGVALGGEPDFTSEQWSYMALGDDMTTIGWWDDTIDGAVYTEFAEDLRMKEGAALGLLLDLDNCRLELYVDKLFVGAITVPQTTYTPVCFTRTHFDRLTIVSNPTLPDLT